jgi:proton-dependent oligopeptide transporter, POT family
MGDIRDMGHEKHPPGLYVLFATEMWERFSFYTMGAMFTLYLQDKAEGFGWTKAEATELNANYLMFVYLSPLVGGILAEAGLGYRRSVMIGGFFFMAGHLLLAFHSLTAVYAALACLVIGNGFFKPNVSTMVGNLYARGSPLRDRAYNIFYLGINVGAFLAPIIAEVMRAKFGYHPAFAVAAFGMVISVAILWIFKQYVEDPTREARIAATDAETKHAIDAVPDWLRIAALVVIFANVVVFWMVFNQNRSTLTYWANDNTNWKVSGIISNAINAFWIIVLTFPVIGLWHWLRSRNLEPSTPTKMVFGMVMASLAFFILFLAARQGEATLDPGDGPYDYRVSPAWLIGAYAVLTLGELMLSPMGLSLVSKVSPLRWRSIMMGGWFVATALGGKLSRIGVYWEEWSHSTFWLVLSGAALGMAIVLALLLVPLKKAMPGV